MCWAFHSYVVDKMYGQTVQGLADYAQKLTLCLLYSKGVGNARLLLCLISCLSSLFIPQLVSSATNLTLGIEVIKMNGCMGHK